MKKLSPLYIITILAIVAGLFFPSEAIYAEDKTTILDDVCTPRLLDGVGKIDKTKSIDIDGETNSLYCVFSDRLGALSQIKKKTPEVLKILSDKFSLDELTESNWRKYENAASEIDSSKISDEEYLQLETLKQFFDIYGNDEQNEEIEKYVEDVFRKRSKNIQNEKNAIGKMLPYYTPAAQRTNRVQMAINNGDNILNVSVANVSKAVSYAKKYAVNSNKNAYGEAGWFGKADCTNFASQILEASGIGQVSGKNERYGWWHKKTNNKHKYSISWINSDTFARYMGVGWKGRKHQSFVSNIGKGDLIALDNSSDGSWDHIGFVSDKSNISVCSEKGGTFKNYQIAQHSDNYIGWANSRGRIG